MCFVWENNLFLVEVFVLEHLYNFFAEFHPLGHSIFVILSTCIFKKVLTILCNVVFDIFNTWAALRMDALGFSTKYISKSSNVSSTIAEYERPGFSCLRFWSMLCHKKLSITLRDVCFKLFLCSLIDKNRYEMHMLEHIDINYHCLNI